MMRMISQQHFTKFTGKEKDYLHWRSAFIISAHDVYSTEQAKILALKAALDTENIELAALVDDVLFAPDGYRNTIEALEKRFGDETSIMYRQREKITSKESLSADDISSTNARLHSLKGFRTMMKEMGTVEQLNDKQLLRDIQKSMPKKYRDQYTYYISGKKIKPTFDNIIEWFDLKTTELQLKIDCGDTHTSVKTGKSFMSRIESGSEGEEEEEAEDFTTYTRKFERKEPQVQSSSKNNTGNRQEKSCDLCSENHLLVQCKKYQDMSPQQRRNFVDKAKRCFICLKKGHGRRECKSRYQRCKDCKQNHHHSLHGSKPTHLMKSSNTYMTSCKKEFYAENSDSIDSDDQCEEKSTNVALKSSTQASFNLLTISVWVQNPNTKKKMYVTAALDSCSDSTFICEELKNELELQTKTTTLNLQGITGKERIMTGYADVIISSYDETFKKRTTLRYLRDLAGPVLAKDWNEAKNECKDLDKVEFPPHAGDKIKILIGTDMALAMRALEADIIVNKEALARKTPLGWAAFGLLHTKGESGNSSITMLIKEHRTTAIQELSNDNPADIASRGLDINNLISSKMWWNGPELLLEENEKWPKPRKKEKVPETAKEELRKNEEIKEEKSSLLTKINLGKLEDLGLEKFSDFSKMVKVMGYVKRFISKLKESTSRDKNLRERKKEKEVNENITFPNTNDNVTRTVSVHSEGKTYRRHVCKLMLLIKC